MTKVLIVDDTQTLIRVVKVYLMGWNLEYREAGDGAAALKVAREWRPDLVISDVRMPGMDGFELTAHLRADPDLHGVPVVLLTSFGDDASKKKGKLVGANAFLEKGQNLNQLRLTIRELLGLPEPRSAR
jgi:twitching motility two-component system response regulator PilG